MQTFAFAATQTGSRQPLIFTRTQLRKLRWHASEKTNNKWYAHTFGELVFVIREDAIPKQHYINFARASGEAIVGKLN